MAGADLTFRSRGLALPTAQVNANSIPLLPRLIARSDLLGFLSRHTLGATRERRALREIKLEETTLRRQLGVTCRTGGYLSPAAQRLLAVLRARGEKLFAT